MKKANVSSPVATPMSFPSSPPPQEPEQTPGASTARPATPFGSSAPPASSAGLAKIAAVALKVGPKLLPLLKLAKSGKFLLLFASFAGYAWLWGPLMGVGVLALIAVHEAGHVWAMRKAGIKTKGMYFLPFMGAVAVIDQNLQSRWQEYWLTIMGPVFGLAGTLAVLIAYFATGHKFFLVLTLFGAFINLINLLPVLPLDGGRILRSITLSSIGGRVGFVGVAVVSAGAGAFAAYAGFTLFAILMILGLWELYGDYRRWRAVHAWREQHPIEAMLADSHMLRDPQGNPVEIPRELAPMTVQARALGALFAIALAIVLAGLWLWASHEAGLPEIGALFD